MPTEPEQRDHAWYRDRTVAVFEGTLTPYIATINDTGREGLLGLLVDNREVYLRPTSRGWERHDNLVTLYLCGGEGVAPWHLSAKDTLVPTPVYEWLLWAATEHFSRGLAMSIATSTGMYQLIDVQYNEPVGSSLSIDNAARLVDLVKGR